MTDSGVARSGRSTPTWGVVVVLCLLVAAVTASLVLSLAWVSTPAAMEGPDSEGGSLPVAVEPFTDAHLVTLSVRRASTPEVLATADGVVTSLACAPGGVVESGDVVGVIGDRPVVALATETPLWRPVRVGSTGADVESLSTELARLGMVDEEPSEHMSGATFASLAKLLKLQRSPTEIAASDVAWLPARDGDVLQCPVPVGARVSAGDPLVVLRPAIIELVVDTFPANAAEGPRTLTIDNVTVPLERDTISQVNDLTQLGQTSEFLMAELRQAETVAGQWSLADPVDSVRVPASALVSDRSGSCVFSGGQAWPVNVLSSSLGQSVISFGGEPPATVDLVPALGATCR